MISVPPKYFFIVFIMSVSDIVINYYNIRNKVDKGMWSVYRNAKLVSKPFSPLY